MIDFVCAECGTSDDTPFHDDPRFCHTCGFWLEKVAMADSSRVVRRDGFHYVIGDSNSAFPGNYGRRYEIRFLDGRVVETSNLWNQGEIPPRFRDRLPDNALSAGEKAA